MNPHEAQSAVEWWPRVEPMLKRITEIEARLPAIEREQRAALAALLPVKKLVANMEREVDETGAAWEKEDESNFLRRLSGRLPDRYMQALADVTGRIPPPSPPALPWGFKDNVPFGALCLLVPEEVKRGFRARIAAQMKAYKGAVMPDAARDALLAGLAKERTALVNEHEHLVERVYTESKKTVTIEHLKEVKDRQETARIQREREALSAERRRAHERKINEIHAKSTAAFSQYLTENAPRRMA